MNTARTAVLLATASLLLAACASTPELASQTGTSASGEVESMEYVDAVNYVAKSRGVRVVWVNPPRAEERPD